MTDKIKDEELIAFPVDAEEAKVDKARAQAKDDQEHRTEHEIKALQAQAEHNNTRDPVEEEKRNNKRMFARGQMPDSDVVTKLVDVQTALERKQKKLADIDKERADVAADIAALSKAEHALKTVGEAHIDAVMKSI
jgi:hypothetical protein